MDPHEYNPHEQAEPHLSSFMPTPEPEHSEVPHEEFEDELTPEEKRDKTLSITFTLVGALVVVAALGYYINNRMQPQQQSQRAGSTPDLYVSDTELDNANGANGVRSTDQNFNYYENTRPVPGYPYAGQPDPNAVTPTEDTFAKPDDNNQSNNATAETVTATDSNPSSASAVNTPKSRNQTLSETVVSYELGVAFLKDPYWTESLSSGGKSMTLRNVGPKGKDTIFMTRFKGKTITTKDPAYGNVDYYFDYGDKVWMRLDYAGAKPGAGDTARFFVPMLLTDAGDSVLEGTTKYKTLIIAFGVEDFLIVNINGSGYTAILDSFVRKVRNIQ